MKLRPLKGSKGVSMIGAVTAVIVAIVAISIGIIIAQELVDAFDTDLAASADFSGGWNSTKDMTASGFNILPVVIIILAAVPVIGAVLLLGR